MSCLIQSSRNLSLKGKKLGGQVNNQLGVSHHQILCMGANLAQNSSYCTVQYSTRIVMFGNGMMTTDWPDYCTLLYCTAWPAPTLAVKIAH